MIDLSSRLTPAQIEQTDRNLEFLERFIQQYVEDPERFDHIPSGATLIFLPPDDQGDSELRQANLRMAEEWIAKGRNVVVLTFGVDGIAEPESLVSHQTSGSDV